MVKNWLRPRNYKHFDVPVGKNFAEKTSDVNFIARHSWSPLIHYVKREKRYRQNKSKTEYKCRDIMYASHRDACIFSRYAYNLNKLLNDYYNYHKLSESVIAYRALGRANYHFSAQARNFAVTHIPCIVICFDVSKFFDTLDHKILKSRLKQVLDLNELPSDWYAVFKAVTKFRYVKRHSLCSSRCGSEKQKEC